MKHERLQAKRATHNEKKSPPSLFLFRLFRFFRLFRNPRKASVTSVITVALAASTVVGCGWSFLNEHSVRFHGQSSPSFFTRLPSLPIRDSAPKWTAEMEISRVEDPEFDAVTSASQKLDELWEKANQAEAAKNFVESGKLLREFLQRTSAEPEGCSYDPDLCRLRRNSAIDRLDALTAPGRSVKPSLDAYLSARRAFDDQLLENFNSEIWRRADQPGKNKAHSDDARPDLDELIERIPREQSIVDNVAYLRAAILYKTGKFEEAAKAFGDLASKYPGSEKREAALFMKGLALRHLHCPSEDYAAVLDSCKEGARRGRDAMNAYLREYPRGRYAFDAREFLAFLSILSGDRASALIEYFRLYSEAADPLSKRRVLLSLRLTRPNATKSEIERVEEGLMNHPAAALTYAYHSIYNFSPDAGYFDENYKDPDYSDEYAKERAKIFIENASDRELSRIAAFANKLLQRYPRSNISGGFALRLAQANLELDESQLALQHANHALRLGAGGRQRAEALWVKGSAEFHLKEYQPAIKTLKQLIVEKQAPDLIEGAGRLIAMAAEDIGDLDSALEQYIEMDYEDDVAYFVDVLMTTEQLKAFIARHPQSKKINELNYALGVRYLRGRQWSEAKTALARVKVTDQEEYRYYSSTLCDDRDPIAFRSSCTPVKASDPESGIRANWILRDLKTAEDMERFEREYALARGPEAEAEARYQMASYLYQGSSLLFYNPNLWSARHYKLFELTSNNSYRAPNEAQLLFSSMKEHEPVSQALDIYLDIVQRYPNTRAARDALYTAAVCHERLSQYNNYWREAYDLGLHAGQRLVTYNDVRKAYPDYQLPRGTIGWEPATRTVYGGPGWNAPPKPAPKLTKREIFKRRFDKVVAKINETHELGYVKLSSILNVVILWACNILGLIIIAGLSYIFTLTMVARWSQRGTQSLMLDIKGEGQIEVSSESRVERIIKDESRK